MVVRSAYLAANRGRFADANRLVDRKALRRLAQSRSRLRSLLGGSAFRDPNSVWKALTRDRSLRAVSIVQETVRG